MSENFHAMFAEFIKTEFPEKDYLLDLYEQLVRAKCGNSFDLDFTVYSKPALAELIEDIADLCRFRFEYSYYNKKMKRVLVADTCLWLVFGIIRRTDTEEVIGARMASSSIVNHGFPNDDDHSYLPDHVAKFYYSPRSITDATEKLLKMARELKGDANYEKS